MSQFMVSKKTMNLGQPGRDSSIFIEKRVYSDAVLSSDYHMSVTRRNFDINAEYSIDYADGSQPIAVQGRFPSGKYDALSATPVQSGKRFIGWFDNPEFPLSDVPSMTGLMTANDYINTAKLSVYAHWQLPVNVVFDAQSNGGQMPAGWESPEYYAGQQFGLLPKPLHPSLYFTGWYTASSGGDRITKSASVSGACTLYAQYASAVYEIEDIGDEWELDTTLNPDPTIFDGCYKSFSNFGLSGPNVASMTLRVAGYPKFDFYIRSWGGQYDYVDCTGGPGCHVQQPEYQKTAGEEYYEQKKAEYEALGYTVQSNTVAGIVYWTAEDQDGTQIDAGSFSAPPSAGSTVWHGSGDQSISGYLPVTYTFDDPAENIISIRYSKSGAPENDDRGYVLIPKNQQTDITPYLTFTALEDGSSVRFAYFGNNEEAALSDSQHLSGIAFEKSENDGEWQLWDFSSVQLNTGDKLKLRSANPKQTQLASSLEYQCRFVMTGRIAASGNIMSLVDASCQLSVVAGGAFIKLFYGCQSLVTAPDLPARKVNGNSYNSMFFNCINLLSAAKMGMSENITFAGGQACVDMYNGCSSLVFAPDIISYPLVKNATFSQMFGSCTSLSTPPNISCRIAETGAFQFMFQNCTSLTSTPVMTIDAISGSGSWFLQTFENCQSLTTNRIDFRFSNIVNGKAFCRMFNNCRALTSAPDFGEISVDSSKNEQFLCAFFNCQSLTAAPALTALNTSRTMFQYMFKNCNHITTCSAVSLPAMNLSQGCYYGMFENCALLSDAPELPATTMAQDCYRAMFANTQLREAPYLPATSLTTTSYRYMFNSCASLSSISVELTSWNPSGATNTWVTNVAANGVFTCPSSLAKTRGVNNIPNGWTINEI